MAEITLSPTTLKRLQRKFDDSDETLEDLFLEACESYTEAVKKNRGEDAMVESKVAEQVSKLYNACPVCGEPSCNREIGYIGRQMIHYDQHPENRGGF